MSEGTRVTMHPYGPGTVVKGYQGKAGPHTPAVVQFDSGKRYVVYARRLRRV